MGILSNSTKKNVGNNAVLNKVFCGIDFLDSNEIDLSVGKPDLFPKKMYHAAFEEALEQLKIQLHTPHTYLYSSSVFLEKYYNHANCTY